MADDIAKVLRSAIANAQQKDGFSGDVDRLFVAACFANQGPSAKRGMACADGPGLPRVLKRTAHLTVLVSERPEAVVPVATTEEAPKQRTRSRAAGSATRARGGNEGREENQEGLTRTRRFF